MSKSLKKYKSEFKARLALEAIKGNKTLVELGQEHGIHPTVIGEWKQQFLARAASVFEQKGKPETDHQAVVDNLYRKIGQLEMERDFLASRSGVILDRSGKK